MSGEAMAERNGKDQIEQAHEAVLAYAASGKSLQEYCSETGQSYWALRRWRLKFADELGVPIRRRAGARKSNAGTRVSGERNEVAPSPRARLIPVQIADAGASSSMTVEVRLRGGRSLVVSPGIDEATLSRLIGVIERAT